MRYLIASDHGWLGGFGFAASALTLRDRDQWMGWDHSIRKQYLFRVINMSRFLIRPSVHCRNLASHCMGMALRRIASDFKAHNFSLPAPRFTGNRKRSVKRLGMAVELPEEVPAKACEVLGLHLVQVSTKHENLIWNELMMREHPRKAGRSHDRDL